MGEEDDVIASHSQLHVKPFSDLVSGEEINDSPIEEVRLTVPITDDTTLPCLTFRTWVLGIASCIILSYANKFFGFRANPLFVSSVTAQIAVVPIGKLMAATLPTRQYTVPFTSWSFTLNPGPFNLKENVLITMFASCGSGGVYADHIIISVKAYYHQGLKFAAAFFLVLTLKSIFSNTCIPEALPSVGPVFRIPILKK
ncbi:oligopeptide transporter 1-like [Chenopodium quinoa]|uniref:oligopeptide transporter 1-like n=1 Tax=Chenopodium quinoa TaxID=63459 RepID=UPI000B774306|nr:oligopeptide transporter 1-like [Chenopodium quinoa]